MKAYPPHVDKITAELRRRGATDIEVLISGAWVRIDWMIGTHPCWVMTAEAPRDPDRAAATGLRVAERLCDDAVCA